MNLKVGARGSKLSRRQVEEVMGELKVDYDCLWVETTGDQDLVSPLGPMEKTDFFTREIDEMVLKGVCDIGVHSAKDLPEPLPKGLKMVALTQGVDQSDSLVMREGESFEGLRSGAVIGSSSRRRNHILKKLRPDLLCKEVRGPVDRRLEKLDAGEVDGLVVAEAALVRLGLTGRNRISLPGDTAPFQGQLAVVAREGDQKMEELFKPIDIRKKRKALYLGTDKKEGTFHLPLIEIVPRDFQGFEFKSVMADLPDFTHIIFTSKNGVRVFFDCLAFYGLKIKGGKIFAVGKVTAKELEKRGVKVDKVAEEEMQEGVISLLAMEELDDAYVLLPQSSGARPLLLHELMMRRVRHQRLCLYDTKVKIPPIKPELTDFDEIIFTSPSTVDAFLKVFDKIPKGMKMTSIGPITQKALKLKI
ncbi:MAG: hydroxymethylbilane synthase [Chlamydiia bacterium]|nr:hydroxymethylbilane synthase [Chlamydiia bacterium]